MKLPPDSPPASTSRHNVYRYENMLYVPTLCLTEAGFYWENDPVARVDNDEAQLRAALAIRIAEGNRRIPSPDRDALSVVSRAAGARTLLVFERRARLWVVFTGEQDLILESWERVTKGGWEPGTQERLFETGDRGLDELVAAIVTDGGT